MPGQTVPRTNNDETLAGLEQQLADTDQRLSDADQRCSDSDQAGSDRDQLASDRDQLASDRDQAASDQALLFGLGAHAHALSRDARRDATLLRRRAARSRLATAGARGARP